MPKGRHIDPVEKDYRRQLELAHINNDEMGVFWAEWALEEHLHRHADAAIDCQLNMPRFDWAMRALN